MEGCRLSIECDDAVSVAPQSKQQIRQLHEEELRRIQAKRVKRSEQTTAPLETASENPAPVSIDGDGAGAASWAETATAAAAKATAMNAAADCRGMKVGKWAPPPAGRRRSFTARGEEVTLSRLKCYSSKSELVGMRKLQAKKQRAFV
ncbi:hypothetical protein V2J09_013776 [Rumex salicifolius]